MRQNPQVILLRNEKHWRNRNGFNFSWNWAFSFSTLHTRSAYQTISRIIDSFEAGQQNQIRLQLADALTAVFSQRLLKTQDWTWVKMVKEILVNNSAIWNLIRENQLHKFLPLCKCELENECNY